jgi:hypothetical protein
MFSKTLTRSGNDDDPNPVGVGFYYIDDMRERHAKIVVARCLTKHFDTGKYDRRCVFYGRDGKAISTGWFLRTD